jgi:LEA14-like dessication related protein
MKRTLLQATLLTALCLLLAVISASVTGCSTLHVVNPTYSIRQIRPHVAIALPLSESAIDFDFNLIVDNPNAVGIRLDAIDFDLLVNGSPLLQSISTQQGIHIPARGYGEARLRTRVTYQTARAVFREVAESIQGNRAHYELRGTAYYHTPLGQLRFPVTVYANQP